MPSLWNADHKRFYTPASLLNEFEISLRPIRTGFDICARTMTVNSYELGPEVHARGGYEIELVTQKIASPEWDLAGPADPFQDDLEKAQGEVFRLTSERDALLGECARWFDAAILAKAEQVPRFPRRSRARRLQSFARLLAPIARPHRSLQASPAKTGATSSGSWPVMNLETAEVNRNLPRFAAVSRTRILFQSRYWIR